MSHQGGVFWLDIATDCGWAWGTEDDIVLGPKTGVWELKQYLDLGEKGCAFENALCDALWSRKPRLLGIEAPLPAGQQSNAKGGEILIGLALIARVAAYRWSVPFAARSSSTVRSQVIGRARRTDAEKAAGLSVKQAVVAPWTAARGWRITDHNAADAAVGWAFEIGIRAPGRQA